MRKRVLIENAGKVYRINRLNWMKQGITWNPRCDYIYSYFHKLLFFPLKNNWEIILLLANLMQVFFNEYSIFFLTSFFVEISGEEYTCTYTIQMYQN